MVGFVLGKTHLLVPEKGVRTMSAEDRNGQVSTDEECTDCTEREHSFDTLTRGLANGSISRRKALRVLGASLVGSVLAAFPGVALAAPPAGKCKPQGAKCNVPRDCCSQNCFTQSGKLICGPVLGACFNDNDCTSFPGQNLCTRAVCDQATNACVLEPKTCPPSNNPCAARTECNLATGECVEIAGNAGTVCREADGPCDVAEVCTGTSNQCPENRFQPNDTPCNLDEDLCTLDTCQNGQCQAGPQKTCPSSNNPCVARTECNPVTGECVEIAGNAGTVCRSAQGECDLPALCTGASTTCPDNPLKDAGTVCREADGPCDVAEVCTGTSNQCPENEFLPNDTPCNLDEDLCTLDTCQNGQCQAGPQKTCPVSADPCKVNVCNPATGDCVTENAPNNTPCEDGNLCTLNDTCQGGTCQPGSPRTCPVCQTCSGATGTCVAVTCTTTPGQICCLTGPRAGTCGVAFGAPCTSANSNCCTGTCKRNMNQACRPEDNSCTCRS